MGLWGSLAILLASGGSLRGGFRVSERARDLCSNHGSPFFCQLFFRTLFLLPVHQMSCMFYIPLYLRCFFVSVASFPVSLFGMYWSFSMRSMTSLYVSLLYFFSESSFFLRSGILGWLCSPSFSFSFFCVRFGCSTIFYNYL